MDGLGTANILHFEGFSFDRAGGCLTRLDGFGVAEPIALGSRALDLLALLVERQGQLVSKDEILSLVWPGTAVEEGNLTVQVSALRRVLDRDRAQGSCIQTVPGRGYRFVAPVKRFEAPGSIISAPVFAAAGAPPPPRLSIVVLPFTNLSGDREQQYFADGITDDLTTDLSRIPHMFVIARNTAFTYRDKPVPARLIGRDLGVRYVLEGSVRRSGNQVRINAQLIDVETDAHLWAERFDEDTSDVLALQNLITSRIAIALDTELVAAEVARPTVDPDALDFLLRGRAAFSKPPTLGSLAEAIDWIERALTLDPRSAEAQSLLAYVYAFRVLNQMTHTHAGDIARAEELVSQAFAATPRSPLVHLAKGQIFRAQGRYEEAIFEYETVIAYDRNAILAIAALGFCRLGTGPLEEAIAAMEQAIRLSPRDPRIGIWYYVIGRVHLLQSRNNEAILWLEKARRTYPGFALTYAYLASAYALQNQIEPANAALAEARRLSLDDRYSSIARLKIAWLYGGGEMRALHEATFFAGLRKAGMPEE